MEKKRDIGQMVEAFFAGKGFYIVLFLCIAVIAVSAWVMFIGFGANVDSPVEFDPLLAEASTTYSAPVITAGFSETGNRNEPAIGEVETDGLDMSAAESYTDYGDEPVGEIYEEAEPAVEVQEETAAEVWVESAPEPLFFIWPVVGEIELPFAVSSLVYDKTMADWRAHSGIDIAGELGALVFAASSGTVESVTSDSMYGVTVVIAHSDGFRSVYSNLAELPTVGVGDRVSAGDIIGAIGNTALAETNEVNHLHFSMTKDGVTVDPLEHLPLFVY